MDFLWDYAEQHGVADRLMVAIGSDFGRTNHYNAEGGKDHWPIGSYVVMEKNQPWTNRVVGETDSLHFAQKINPCILRRDDANGTIVYPSTSTRRCVGIWASKTRPALNASRSTARRVSGSSGRYEEGSVACAG